MSREFERDVTADLLRWKKRSNKNVMLVRGARQVGKTYSVEAFGYANYESVVSINFLKESSMKRVFSGDLDSRTILLNLSLYRPDFKLKPGSTLIFLDEIQECPEAITALKFLNEDRSFDVIASGSLLGIDYKRATSFPVGATEYLDMFPMSFTEFLKAYNISDDVIGILQECFDKCTPVPVAVHERMMELVREYMVLGGMPEVLTVFFETGSYAAADEKQRAILEDYKYDIAHYASADIKIKAEKCYFSIAGQLSKSNHKFMYSVVENKGTARKFSSSLDWLTGAYLAYRSFNISSYAQPLASSADRSNFRIYPSDIGLLSGMMDYSVKEKIISGGDDRFNAKLKGDMYEAVVADVLIKNRHDLYFRKTENSDFEIEFIIENADGVIPVEVKSGRSRSRSLDNLLKRDEIKCGYKLINGNTGREGKKIILPLYMAVFL